MTNNQEIWRAVSKGSFAIISYVNRQGEPRSTGVVYATNGTHLYTAVAPDSWKADFIAAHDRVAVTIPVRRGGLLSLLLPIPPATISFHGRAIVHPAGWLQQSPVREALRRLLPPERQTSALIIEVVPQDAFLTYGIGVPLTAMRHPALARARLPVA